MSDKLNEVELEDLIENNKYLTRKSFDVSTILVDGEIPKFDSDVESVMCAIDVAKFLSKNGVSNHKNLFKYLESLPPEQVVILLKRIPLEQLRLIVAHPLHKSLSKRMMGAFVVNVA